MLLRSLFCETRRDATIKPHHTLASRTKPNPILETKRTTITFNEINAYIERFAKFSIQRVRIVLAARMQRRARFIQTEATRLR
mmetsp:Transcript_13070/g.26544  ORF Transcript_13070/g.26544 Transcript_13070/m.26544 type:complete len:83 (-) Transcript_13070:303-551(-)